MNPYKALCGLEIEIPQLEIGEIFFCNDTHNTFVGTQSGNVIICVRQTRWKMFKKLCKDTWIELIRIIKWKEEK